MLWLSHELSCWSYKGEEVATEEPLKVAKGNWTPQASAVFCSCIGTRLSVFLLGPEFMVGYCTYQPLSEVEAGFFLEDYSSLNIFLLQGTLPSYVAYLQ